MPKRLNLENFRSFDICSHFHGMNDFGIDRVDEDGTRHFSKSRTVNAECHLMKEGKNCPYQGQCVKAKFY